MKQESVQCPVCSLALVNSLACTKHLSSVHPTFDKYFCTLCGDKQYSEKALAKHTKKIHQFQNSECEICHLQFEAKAGLNLHMIKVHKIHLKKFKKMKKE